MIGACPEENMSQIVYGILNKNYSNARSLRNKFAELKAYVNHETPDIIFITETWVKISVQNNKFSQRNSLNEYYLS